MLFKIYARAKATEECIFQYEKSYNKRGKEKREEKLWGREEENKDLEKGRSCEREPIK